MSKSYRNRLSLFLRLPSTKSHAMSSRGISSDSFPADSFSMASPVSSTLEASTVTASPPPPPYSPRSLNPVQVDSTAPVEGEPIPPTTNELDAKEKARLLRSSRKLSKVFGEMPSLPAPPVPRRESHKRSSSLASASSLPSRARKSPSQQNLPHISEASDFGARRSLQHQRRSTSSREQSVRSSPHSSPRQRNVASPPEDDEPRPDSAHSSRRERMAKLQRHLGEDNIPAELVSEIHPLNHRKSLDTLPLQKSKKPQREKQIRKARSFATEKPPLNVPIQDAVDFHRRYVQNFGEAGAMLKEKETSESGAARTRQDESLEFYEEVDTSSSSSHSVGHALSDSGLPHHNSSFLSLTPRHSEEDLRSSVRRSSDSVLEPTGTSTFQDRRRRAAKLTQFFGVGYQDISSSLPQFARDNDFSPGSDLSGAGVRVDVKMSSRRFWGDGHGTVRDADMVDVIDKLRGLKAS
ncbi:hypothetical protein D9758_000124 [Tetrapyrgos nigripes]|uniref:Uncharacterized protein n=1 Tax=Tetrapyrgos nigripes TaxID=182062 RepID=A0A8H5H183_9AGAR|nr:hypothetical protein D9758_000124 [Tetrapyrgos nigripes]